MGQTYERKITPAGLVAGGYDVSQTISVGAGFHTIDRISVEPSGSVLSNVIVSFVYTDVSPGRESHLGNGMASLRYPLVLKGPFEVEGSGYIQLMFWIPEVGDTAEINVVFRRKLY